MCGCVKSIEDHGYLIDFGVSGKSGFLLKKNASEYGQQHSSKKSLVVGQVVNCLVLSGDSTRTVPVTISPETIQSSFMSNESLVPLSSLLPGFLVNAVVKESIESGLLLSFMEGFEGTVSANHLPNGKFDTQLYPIGKKVKARLLWIDVLNKRMGLSLKKHIVCGTGYQFMGMEIGDVFHSCKVLNVNPHVGIILDVGNGIFGFSPLRLLYDEKTEKVERVHSVGSVHSSRIIQFNLIDGYLVLSLQQSVIEKRFMRLSDIKPGTIIDGEVKVLTDKGVFIKLGDSFDGFCSNAELTDRSVKVMRKKIAVGSPIKCRVLLVDLEHRFVLLTCKKSRLKPDPPLALVEESSDDEEDVDDDVVEDDDDQMLVIQLSILSHYYCTCLLGIWLVCAFFKSGLYLQL